MKTTPFALAATLFVSALTVPSAPAELRQIRPIGQPAAAIAIPATAQSVGRVISPARSTVRGAVDQIVERWNSRTLSEALGESFVDSNQLLRALDTSVPRDAMIRVLAIRDVQTIQQYLEADNPDAPARRVTVLAVTISTQIEYDNATEAVQLPGVNELILKISEEV